MRRLVSILDRLLYGSTALCAATVFLMVLASVFSRYVFKTPIMAAVEISRLAFVWACFLAAAIAFKRQAHISITVLADKLPEAMQRACRRFILILAFLLGLTLIITSLRVTVLLWNSKLPVMGISQGWFYLPVTVFAAYLCLYAVEQAREQGRAG